MKVLSKDDVAQMRVKRYPIIETFGPTIQGEGPDAGRPVYFVRVGGCDYKCSWCDSMHAVDPQQVMANKTMMTAEELVDNLVALGATPGATIVLSGGNPALLDLSQFVADAQMYDWRITVETQGTKFKPWLVNTDLVVCSPKPPSSRMVTDWTLLDQFIDKFLQMSRGANTKGKLALKVVVGDEDDYQFAKKVHTRYGWAPFYVSVLNPAGSVEEAFNVNTILAGYRELCERVANDPQMQHAIVLPQLHTLAWGAKQGV